MFRRKKAAELPIFSKNSTSAVPPSLWFASDFLLGAGMVIIQPETEKIVVIHDTKSNIWFLPKGRKDVGESLEQTALREAYEESGYRVEFLPLYTPTRAPVSPDVPRGHYELPNTEPIYVSVISWAPRKNHQSRATDNGGEYLSFYYVGQIPPDAVHNEGTGMPDEQSFTTHLLSVKDAVEKAGWLEGLVIHKAWKLWQSTVAIQADLRTREALKPSDRVQEVPQNLSAESGVVFIKVFRDNYS
ncbi:hypothetical protein PILCRDRAFT_820843 [Piloderma croceum F 1598]|uniref:Nudix hydrolase domain-containing protein n=1 Tax=Piloderma croceum (strain F 1598) TaxID=765440 RepID=A0A0C3FB98_PILCF|nr:hypothetical protein PILCRDRAFT_820843 [Piloderma croceum F 1598]